MRWCRRRAPGDGLTCTTAIAKTLHATAANVAAGMSRVEAERAARTRVDSVEAVVDHTRNAGLESAVDALLQDLRYAVRGLLGTPAFTVVVVLTLSLGIGANTAVFSVVNSLLFRSLPVAHAERLAIVSTGPAVDGVAEPWSYPVWQQIRQRARLFDSAAAWAARALTVSRGGHTVRAEGLFVSGEFFTTLGVKPMTGRLLLPADDVPGAAQAQVAVISHRFWRREFGAAPGALGSTLTVGQVPFTIIGVTPPEFWGAEVGRDFDLAVPLAAEAVIDGEDNLLDKQRASWLAVVLRLKPGQTLDAATAALRGVQSQIRDAALGPLASSDMRERFLPTPFTVVSAATGLSQIRQQYRQPVLILLVIVVILLMLACANLANLFLARSNARQHQVSVRLALGATRGRVARQLAIETLLLAAGGALAGLALASWAATALVARLSSSLSPVFLEIALDGRVLAFTAAATLVTAVVFGTFPAVRTAGASPLDALRDNSRTATAHGDVVSKGLAIAQVTMSVVLMIAAGLFLRSFAGLANVPRGFNADRVLVVEMTQPGERTAGGAEFRRQLLTTAAVVPEVSQVALSATTPLGGAMWNVAVEIPGGTTLAEPDRIVRGNRISPGWFATYGIPIVRGRDFGIGDSASSEPVAVGNEAFVAKFFGGGDALGRYVVEAPASRRIQRRIVGVVKNTVYRTLREEPPPTLYVPLEQTPYFDGEGMSLSVRAARRPQALVLPLSQALTAMDSRLALDFRPLQDQVDTGLARERMLAWVSGGFGLVAIALAGVGLYGMTAYSVERRRREIGVRLALGARRADIFRLIVGQSVTMTVIGILVGLVAAAGLTRYLAAMLFGLTPLDPQTFALVSLLLWGVGAIGALIPAYRATLADPRTTTMAD